MMRRARWILGIAGVSLVLAPVAYVWSYDRETSQREAAALATLKRYGHVTTLEEYERTRPAEADNAAPILADLAKSWGLLGPSKERIDADKPSATDAQTVALLEKHRADIAKLDRLRLRKRLWYPFIPHDFSIRLDPLTKSRTWGEALAASARREAARGNFALAKERLGLISVLGDLWIHEGSLVGGLSGNAIHARHNQTLLRMIAEAPSLDQKKMWRGLLPEEPRAMKLATCIGQEALFYRYLFAPRPGSLADSDEAFYQHPERAEDRLLKVPQIQRRVVTLGLEGWADIAEASADGVLSKTDSDSASRKAHERVARETFARALGEQVAVIMLDYMTDESANQRLDHLRAAADTIIEQAGGPKAVLPADVQVKKTAKGFEVSHKALFQIFVVEGSVVRIQSDHSRSHVIP